MTMSSACLRQRQSRGGKESKKGRAACIIRDTFLRSEIKFDTNGLSGGFREAIRTELSRYIRLIRSSRARQAAVLLMKMMVHLEVLFLPIQGGNLKKRHINIRNMLQRSSGTGVGR